MIFKLTYPTTGHTLGVYSTRRAAVRAGARCDFPTDVVEVEKMSSADAVDVALGPAASPEVMRRRVERSRERLAGGTYQVGPIAQAGGGVTGAVEVGLGFRSPTNCPKCGGSLTRMLPTPNGVLRKKCQRCDMIYKAV